MVHSFLLVGQSNMCGRGNIGAALPIDPKGIRVLRNGRWQSFYRPVNPDRATAGVCLAESFAEAYVKKYGVDVGLIPCADGGTSLTRWAVGDLLFDNAVNCARLAQRTSTIVGVLWHQGEAECTVPSCYTYAERFQPIMDAFRRELGLENVPFILGGLGDFLKDRTADPFLANYPIVNEQLKLISERNPLVGFVSAEGLTANKDNLHFNSASLHEFGLRYFEEFEKFPKAVGFDTEIKSDVERTAMELL